MISTIKVGETPEGISYDATNHLIFVANWGENNIAVIDATTNKVINHISVGEQPRAFGQFVLQNTTTQ
jgi:YVTN family beta-propeller protein